MLPLVRTFILSFLLLIAVPVMAQNGDTEFMQTQSGLLQHDADSAQAQVEKVRRQAEQYRELAESADQYAMQAADIKGKTEWEKTAKEHRAKAEKLDLEAVQLVEKAHQASAGVTDLQNQIEQRTAEDAAKKEKFDKESAAIAERETEKQRAIDNNPNTGKTVQNVIGMWRTQADDGDPFVVVQKDPQSKAYPHRLQAHTPKRMWEGDFHQDPSPGEPLITFSYKPKAEEMNPDIPEWARKKLEGKLEWKLKISSGGTCGTPTLAVDFYPGHVTWTEGGKKKSEVEGDGEARRIDLRQSVPDMRFYSYGAPQIYLRPTGPRPTKTDAQAEDAQFDFTEPLDTVDALVHGQRFHIEVILPEDEAQKQGEKLTVKIKSAGGDETSVELQSGAMRQGRSVIYTHYDDITISDPLDVTVEDREPPLLSMNYILGYQGERLDLDVENNELVTFSFGEAIQTIPVFNSWVQRGINQHQEAILRLIPFYSIILADASSSKAQKEQATKRLTMIQNYERIMESDKIHDFIRYHVGNTYFSEYGGMIGMSDEDIQAAAELGYSYYPLSDADRDGSKHQSGIYNGVVWTSRYEMDQIQRAITTSRVNYRETALKELPLAMTMAMYTTVMGMSGVGDIYTLRTGKDIFGKPAPGWARIQAAIGLVSSNLLTFTAPHVMTPPSLKAFNSSQLSGRAMRSGARMRYKTHEHINAKYGAQKLEAAMKRVSAAQSDSIAPMAKAVETMPSNKPLPCPKAQKNPSTNMAQLPVNGASAPPPRPAPLDADILSIRKMFGDSTKVVDPGATPLFPPQKFGTCNCSAMARSLKADLGLTVSEMGGYGMMVKKGHVKAGEMPLENGYTDTQATAFVNEMGGEVSTAQATKGRLTPEGQAFMMKQGWRVREVIFTMDTKEPHALEIVEFVRNGNNEITDVRYYDPAHGKILETPICDFTNKLVAQGYDTFLYRWKDDAGQPIRTANALPSPPKPTIELPAPRNPGSPADGSPKLADQPEPIRRGFSDEGPVEDIDPDSIQQIGDDGKVITEGALQQLRRDAQRLDQKLNEFYPGDTKPPINTISRDSLRKIYTDKTWLPPSRGGASFSEEGIGSLRHEVVAVKVRDSSSNFVSMEPTAEGTGLSPKFWPSGQKGVGKSQNYIPAEHLEWIDGDQKAWVPFTEQKIEASEFSLDD